MANLIRVLLVDDHRSIHKTIEVLLRDVEGIELVGQGGNGRDAVQLCEELEPDLLLIDVVMPIMDGVEATKEISERFPHTKILASYQDHESVHSMLHNGAVGYLTKAELTSQLVSTIRATYQGNVVLSQEVADYLLNPTRLQKAERLSLTDRELEVLVQLASGQTMKEIAQELVISSSTVKFHIKNIQSKLGVESRSEALVVAAKNNLI